MNAKEKFLKQIPGSYAVKEKYWDVKAGKNVDMWVINTPRRRYWGEGRTEAAAWRDALNSGGPGAWTKDLKPYPKESA